jgi:hypothetical protein
MARRGDESAVDDLYVRPGFRAARRRNKRAKRREARLRHEEELRRERIAAREAELAAEVRTQRDRARARASEPRVEPIAGTEPYPQLLDSASAGSLGAVGSVGAVGSTNGVDSPAPPRLDAPAPLRPSARSIPQSPTQLPASRRARRERTQNRRFWRVTMPIIAALLAAAVAVGGIVRTVSGSSSGSHPVSRQTPGPPPQTLLLVSRGSDGRADLIALFGVDGNSGSVLLIPGATQVAVPSFGDETLTDLPRLARPAVVTSTLENLLGVRINQALFVTPQSLAALLAPAQPLSANLPSDVSFSASADPAYRAGPARLSAQNAATLLTRAQAVNELQRLVTVQAVLNAWLQRLRQRAVAFPTASRQPKLLMVADMAHAHVRVDTLPVDTLATPDGTLRLAARRGDLVNYVKDAFGGSLIAAGDKRPKVEVLNGTGSIGVAQVVTDRVVPAGYEVLLTNNIPGFGVHHTQVVYYSDSGRAAAQRVLQVLHCGKLAQARQQSGTVDVTVVVGSDCPALGAPRGQ